MANRKISDLTALTAPATGDLLPIVDISEAAAADKNKKITFGELFASILAGTAAAPSIAFEGDSNTGIYSPGADQLAISINGTEVARIDSSYRLLVGTSSAFGVAGRVNILYTSSVESGISIQSSVDSYNSAISFLNTSATQVGTISTSASSTAYSTSSDYRLKENVTPVSDGITRLLQLKPSRFNFKVNPDQTVNGFIAHEAQAVVPECVTGEKDAVDENGNPVYQGIDQSKLVPLLTAALQEAIAKIESLETRLSALEAA
jgi:hypothetical protein